MAKTKSAKKSFRQSLKRKTRRLQRNRKLKKLLKEAGSLVSEGKKEEAKNLLPRLYKELDKASKTKLIKKNTASRKKSRITKLINKNSG